MRLSIKTRQQHTTFDELAAMWVAADRMDTVDAAWVFDHFYPIFSEPTGPCLEGFTLLAALAARTERLRIGVMVAGNTHRHPAILAKMIATIDQISAGRLEVGIGTGWAEQEHAAYGIDLPPLGQRFDRLEEALAVIESLLTRPRTTFEGTHYRLTEAYCEPKGIQSPHPPLVIGGRGEQRTMTLAARYASQWNYPSGPVEDFQQKVAALHARCEEHGRDPASIEISVQVGVEGDPQQVAEAAASYVAAGAQHIILNLDPPYRPEMLEPLVATVAEAIGR
jgi:F420-dependent oxidoreductase-like protein